MKKFICSLMIASVLSFAAPKQEAQASLLVVAGLEHHVWNHKHKFDNYIVPVFGLSLAVYSFFAIYTGMYSRPSSIAGIVMLDAKIENNQANIETVLQTKFPKLDDANVVRKLSTMIVEQYPHVKDAEGNAKIILNTSDVKSAIQRIDLNEEQTEEIVNFLCT